MNSILKQSFIRSENVRLVQNFIITIRQYAILKLLFISPFFQQNLKEPENIRKKKRFPNNYQFYDYIG